MAIAFFDFAKITLVKSHPQFYIFPCPVRSDIEVKKMHRLLI